MMTRISLLSRERTVMGNVNGNLSRVASLQEQLSSGKRVNRMSDDAIASRRALSLRVQQFGGERFIANISRTLTFMDVVDNAYNEMGELLGEVKAAAVNGATGTQDADSRAALAASIDGMLQRLTDVGNTVHDGRFVFAGTAVYTRPFALAEGGNRVEYHGNLDTFEVNIGPTARVAVNQDGHRLFKQPIDVFDALITVRDALLDNDIEGVNAAIEAVDVSQRHVESLRGAMGGRVQRLEMAQRQLEVGVLRLKELISDELDVDMAETIMKLQTSQVALEAGLQTAARVLQPSLLDYL